MRRAHREIGQPLRNYVYGFDSAALWHLFHPDVDDEYIEEYAETVAKAHEILSIPVVYFSTKVSSKGFRILAPLKLGDFVDARYVLEYLRNLCDGRRNPALKHEDVRCRRSALKVALGPLEAY